MSDKTLHGKEGIVYVFSGDKESLLQVTLYRGSCSGVTNVRGYPKTEVKDISSARLD